METADWISVTASVASLILAVVAIWLSIAFYRMSSTLTERTTEAAKGIGASVDRLEKLFDKLYSDTFSMMKDTVQDMRKHIWPDGALEMEQAFAREAEAQEEAAVERVKAELSSEIGELVRRLENTDERVSSVSAQVEKHFDRAMASSRQAEVQIREHALRRSIVTLLGDDTLTAETIVRNRHEVSLTKLLQELAAMVNAGILGASAKIVGPKSIRPETEFWLLVKPDPHETRRPVK